tara:strand:+ start:618 stop:875 length:258 start_codon:yes stop_codon:yes gene_type:complete
MEVLNKVYALIRCRNISTSLVGIFSSWESAKEEVEKVKRRDELFYIQERFLNNVKEPSWEMEIKYSVDGEKSEMIVTRNYYEKDI